MDWIARMPRRVRALGCLLSLTFGLSACAVPPAASDRASGSAVAPDASTTTRTTASITTPNCARSSGSTTTPACVTAAVVPQALFASNQIITPDFPGASWQRADPQSQGFSAPLLDQAVEQARDAGSTSGMIIHAGLVIAQWGDVAQPTNLHSARKSFLSALMGIAVAHGQVHLDQTLAQLGIDDEAPALTAEEKQATVRMLLEARSGVYHPSVYETRAMIAAKPVRGSHAPGTFWYYNNWDFNVLGTLYMQAAGQDLFQALKQDIADPLGMQDFKTSDGRYVSGMPQTRYPAYPFRMSARDLARFALLYLHQGQWQGRQIVPADWVQASTRPYSNTATGGYGYLWWTNVPAQGAAPKGPAMAWADGHLGQYAVVIPSRDLVIVSLVNPRYTRKTMSQRRMLRWVQSVQAAQVSLHSMTRH